MDAQIDIKFLNTWTVKTLKKINKNVSTWAKYVVLSVDEQLGGSLVMFEDPSQCRTIGGDGGDHHFILQSNSEAETHGFTFSL